MLDMLPDIEPMVITEHEHLAVYVPDGGVDGVKDGDHAPSPRPAYVVALGHDLAHS